MSFARVSKWHAWCIWHAEPCPTVVHPEAISSSFPERGGVQQVTQLSPKEVSIWNPSVLLPAYPYWVDWHEGPTVLLSPLLIQRLTEAAGPLGAVPSPLPQQWVERNTCLLRLSIWLLLLSPHCIFLKSGVAKLQSNSQSISPSVSLGTLPE